MRDGRVLGIVVIVLVVVLLAGSALSGGMMGPGMLGGSGPCGFYRPGGWMWGVGMGFGWLAMLAFWGLLIAGGVLLARALLGQPAPPAAPAPPERPLDILERRYAAGEIDQPTFERMKRELEA